MILKEETEAAAASRGKDQAFHQPLFWPRSEEEEDHQGQKKSLHLVLLLLLLCLNISCPISTTVFGAGGQQGSAVPHKKCLVVEEENKEEFLHPAASDGGGIPWVWVPKWSACSGCSKVSLVVAMGEAASGFGSGSRPAASRRPRRRVHGGGRWAAAALCLWWWALAAEDASGQRDSKLILQSIIPTFVQIKMIINITSANHGFL